MNDTILNPRQIQILDLFKKIDELSRTKISGLISTKKPYSKITLIRDLNELIDKGYIAQVGKGRSTTYQLKEKNKLLHFVSLNTYFNPANWDRKAQTNYNPHIFNDLHSLFTEDEKNLLGKQASHLKSAISKLDPTIYQRELERLVIEFSWKSSQIEGNTYDLLETETLIKQKIEAKGHTKEEATMILNHKDAFTTILDNALSFRKLTLSDVMQLHSVLTHDLYISTGIRIQRVGISGTDYVPMSDKTSLKDALEQTIVAINKADFPPEKALIASSMIAYVQPFSDGNKRTSRMLANALLIAHDYFPYRSIEVDEYKKAMILFYEQNNMYHLKRIFMEQMQFSVENYFKEK